MNPKNKPGTLCFDLCHIVPAMTSLLCMVRSASLALLFASWTCQGQTNGCKSAGCSQVENNIKCIFQGLVSDEVLLYVSYVSGKLY